MEVRDAVESDAEVLAAIADAPEDVMRNLVHDRTVRVSETGEDLVGFVSFDAKDRTVHITQLAGPREACTRLLEEPVRFAEREGMTVELLVGEGDADRRAAAEEVGFSEAGDGPRFGDTRTIRYRR